MFRRAEPSLNGDGDVDHKSTNRTRLRGLSRFVVVNELVDAIRSFHREEEQAEPDETEAKKH
jgi:hypothetical protein